MGYAVEMYFDPETERRIRGLWEKLAQEGIRCLLPEIGARPHISLAVWPRIEVARMRAELAGFARTIPSPALLLSAVGVFPTAENVIFLAPAASVALLELHRRFHAGMELLGLSAGEHYRPGRWVPHCTVAQNLPPEQMPRVIEVCRATGVFGEVHLTQVGLVEFRPVRTIATYRLSTPGAEPPTGAAREEPHV